MNKTVRRLLEGGEDNHLMPFFWLHGEEESVLRTMMGAIDGANCSAVCVESRPHPDFCGEGWWRDMDVILDEARKRSMKVWILDDAHFPTGYANGALDGKPDRLCRQNIFLTQTGLPPEAGPCAAALASAGLLKQREPQRTGIAAYFAGMPPARVFDDDAVLSVTARFGEQVLDLTGRLAGNTVQFDKPEGPGTLEVVVKSRNTGFHRNYINMTEKESCRLLIDAVYEPHYRRYADDFGRTIAGFFSDEPELGNGVLYAKGNVLGTDQDLPWGDTLEKQVEEALGPGWRTRLPLLFEDGAGAAAVRQAYMDILSKLVRESFSFQVRDWCREHGVKYIGHVIEDDGQHCRTGSSLAHYFRSLQGQDMAGIDDIGGQVMPQGEDGPAVNSMGQPRNGEFYHYGLAKLAASAAAIEPDKNGDAMCEIFGNYGWSEGIRLEKYLADHFLVRGVNQFVPHAFTARPFPDPDCPPHFYAHGHNPQYRYFALLCAYMNRVSTLISSGKHNVPAAVLYHGEAEWSDNSAMPFEKPLRALYDGQIDCHVLPADIFSEPDRYRTKTGKVLEVNGQRYRAFVVPGSGVICRSAAEGLTALSKEGLPVFFAERKPSHVAGTGEPLPEALENVPVVGLGELAGAVRALPITLPSLSEPDDRIRMLHILGETELFLFVNEGTARYDGRVFLPASGSCFLYDALANCCREARFRPEGNGTSLALSLEPLHSVFAVFGGCDAPFVGLPAVSGETVLLDRWMRSTCEGANYPDFSGPVPVTLPDRLAEEQPEFSGFVRYTAEFTASEGCSCTLEITGADEVVEVFVNGERAGAALVPPFLFDLTPHVREGTNKLTVEAATTLERQCYPLLEGYRKMLAPVPAGGSGLTGTARLHFPPVQERNRT